MKLQLDCSGACEAMGAGRPADRKQVQRQCIGEASLAAQHEEPRMLATKALARINDDA